MHMNRFDQGEVSALGIGILLLSRNQMRPPISMLNQSA